jgi:hypothetical protein
MLTHTCPGCGFVLVDEAPDGTCPACAGPWSIDPLDSLLMMPAASPPAGTSPAVTEVVPNSPARWKWLLFGIVIGGLVTIGVMMQLGFLMPGGARPVEVARLSPTSPTAVAIDAAEVESLRQSLQQSQELERLHQQRAAAAQGRSTMLENKLRLVQEQQAEQIRELQQAHDEVLDLKRLLTTAQLELRAINLQERRPYIQRWRVLGPVPTSDEGAFIRRLGQAALAFDQPVEIEGKQLEWRTHIGESEHLSLNAIFPKSDKEACYLVSYVYADEETPVVLAMGSDDGMAVWLNRDEVHRNRTLRSAARGQDKVQAVLKRGWNELIVNVDNVGGNDWGLYFEFRTLKDRDAIEIYSAFEPFDE